MQTKIKTILQEIKNIFKVEAPNELEKKLIKKATKKAITDFESVIGEPLPEDFRYFLLNNDFQISFNSNFECLPLKQVKSSWEMMTKLLNEGRFDDGRVERRLKDGNWKGKKIKQVWWSPKWIPFAEDSCGNMKCIDLDPGTSGKKYQIISMEVQGGVGPFCASEYSCFLDYLEKNLGYLRNGQFVVTEDGFVEIDGYMKGRK